MKKIIGLVLVIVNLLSFAVYADSDETALYADEFSQLAAYNIMVPLDDESMNKEITQMQFREALMAIAGDDEALIQKIDSFGEVYDANGSVTLTKALISLVKLVGYDDNAIQKGGTYNNGYMSIASNCGILKGVSGLSENKNITYAQAGKLIYNSLNVPLIEVTFKGGDVYYTANEDKTILREYMSIYEVRGVVNATQNYARTGYKVTQDNIIIIGDSEYIISSLSMNAYFGMEVIANYRYNEDSEESKILRIAPRYKESSITLLPSDITEYRSGKYTYITDEMIRSKTLSVETGAVWYYNYEKVQSREQIEKMNYVPEVGSVQLIDTDNNSKYNIVIILDYDVRIVDYVRDKAIYTKNNAGKIDVNSDTVICDANGNPYDSVLSIEENGVVHTIFDTDGVTAKYIVVISSKTEGMVAGVNKTEREISIKDGDVYTVTKTNIAYLDEIKGGINITLYLDINGNVSGYKFGVSSDFILGYMIDIRTYESEETGEPVVRLKLFDITEKKIITLYTIEKFRVDEEKYTTSRYENLAQLFRDRDGKVFDQLIRYKLNKDGLITEIDTAYDGDGNFDPYGIWGFFPSKQTGLVKVAGSQLLKETGQTAVETATPPDEWERARHGYWVSDLALSKYYILSDPVTGLRTIWTYATNLIVDGNTPVLYVPKNRNSVDEYYVTTRAAWNMKGLAVIDAYRVENETTVPSFIVAYEGNGVPEFGESGGAINNIDLINKDSRPALIVDLEHTWYEEEEVEAYRVTLMQSGIEKTCYIKNAEWVKSLEYAVRNKNSGVVLGTVKGLHPGDIISFAESGGFITAIDMYAPKSMIKDYNLAKWDNLSRGIMNNGGYIGYAYARFDDTIMGIKAPWKVTAPNTIDFIGDDVFMAGGMEVFEYDAKRRTIEKSSVDCVDFYTGTEKLEESSVILMFGDGGDLKDNCIYVMNNLFE